MQSFIFAIVIYSCYISSVLDISLTVEEYKTSEADREMIISVCKDKQIPWYPYVRMIVASVMVDNATNHEYLSIPTSHPDSPNKASKPKQYQ